MDKLTAMRVIARVVETGNMTEAARQLGIGQPFISRIVADEEHRLGVSLFHRGPPLRPTEAGLAWARECVDILARVEDAESTLSLSWAQLRGTLRVATQAAFGQWVIAVLLPRFLADNPGISVEIVADRPHFDLDGSTADLAVHVGDLPNSAALVARSLGEIGTGLFAAPAYLSKNGMPEEPGELAAHVTCLHPAIATPGRTETFVLQLTRDADSASVLLRPRLAAGNPSVLAAAAEAGLGIAMLPKPLGQLLSKEGRLRPVLPSWSGPVRPVHAVWPQGRMPHKVRVFVDFLLERINERVGE